MSTSNKDYLTPLEVAELMMVSPVTVRQWANKGELSARVTPGGHRRFFLNDIIEFARKKGLTLNLPGTEKHRILIVDDDEQFNLFLKTILSENPDFEVMSASSGFEAGACAQEFKPHLILLDIMMPDINGIQVCKQIKSNPLLKSTRIIGITGSTVSDVTEEIVSAGAHTCLFKPIDTATLLSVINQCLNIRATKAAT